MLNKSKNNIPVNLKEVIFITFVIYLMFATHFTSNLFYREYRSDMFDSLAKSFLQGEATVDPAAITDEAFVVNNKVYTNFGPFPALIRIIPNLLFPTLYGKWVGTSIFLAGILCVLGFLKLLFLCCKLNKETKREDKDNLFFLSFISFAFGTPVLFLISCSYMYHEARLWGLGWSIWAIYFFLKTFFVKYKLNKTILYFSFCASCAFLARETYGLCFIPLLGLLYFFYLKAKIKPSGLNKVKKYSLVSFKFLCLISPMIFSLAFHCWYNYARFNSIFTFVDHHYYMPYKYRPHVRSIDLATGSALDFRRLPYSTYKYLMFDKDCFSKEFPFVRFVKASKSNPNMMKLYKKYYHYTESIVPITMISIWIFFGSIIGLWNLFMYEKKYLLKIVPIVFLFPIITSFSHVNLTHRYSADMIPFLVFTYFFFPLYVFKLNLRDSELKKSFSIFKILCLFSIITTVLSTLSWNAYNNFGAPQEYVNQLHHFFKLANEFLY